MSPTHVPGFQRPHLHSRVGRKLILALLLLGAFTPALRADNWPGWRGPRGDGTSQETAAPLHWTAEENVAWKTPIPGVGHSSPVIWGERIFLTTCLEKEGKRVLLCLDRNLGKVLWTRTVLEAPLEDRHKLNSYASSTPATDGQHVYVSFLQFPFMIVACYDMNGTLVWKKSPGSFFSKHGFCSPPILYKDLVVLNGDQDAQGFLVALDKGTGGQHWRTDRPNFTRSYCPPLIVKAAGHMQLVMTGSLCVASYDPDNGKQIWIIDGPTEQFVASMVFANNLFYLTAGYPTYHAMAIRPDGVGNVTKTHVQWHETKGAGYVPSPIAQGKDLFLVNDGGIGTCFDGLTGKRLWQERLGKHHSASPIAAAGKIYFVADDGITYVVAASKHFQLLAKNPLNEDCYASPALSEGQIFIRTMQNLYCIGKQTTAKRD
jgi:outer membrane protein assembly factor BamB